MVQLTPSQREVLRTLIELYEKKGRKAMVKSREVARALGKDEGTVRNVIMMLRNMGLVESRTGPAGGYVPTLMAYEVLGRAVQTLVGGGYMTVEGKNVKLMVSRMQLIDLFGDDSPKALLRVGGDLSQLSKGDKVRITSTQAKRLIVEGRILQVNPQAAEVLVNVEKLVIIPNEVVGKIATRKLLKVREDMTVKDVAKFLYDHKIRGAPVVDETGRVVGFITTTDIAMIVGSGGSVDEPVGKYMRKNVFAISENEGIHEAMRLMNFYGVGRLLVVDSTGAPVGIVTRTDILRFILALQEEKAR